MAIKKELKLEGGVLADHIVVSAIHVDCLQMVAKINYSIYLSKADKDAGEKPLERGEIERPITKQQVPMIDLADDALLLEDKFSGGSKVEN